jgi:hypothetical protein
MGPSQLCSNEADAATLRHVGEARKGHKTQKVNRQPTDARDAPNFCLQKASKMQKCPHPRAVAEMEAIFDPAEN